MDHVLNFQCSLCGHVYLLEEVEYTCPRDGGNLDIHLDYVKLRETVHTDDLLESEDTSLWRYLPLLPVAAPQGGNTPLHTAGWTPVFQPVSLAQEVGIERLWVKDESCNPTASFKDRASAVVVARAQQIGADVVVTASTGNAGAALAGMAAAVGQKAVILAPQSAPQAKIAQLLVFGARVILVDGSYDDAFDLSIQAAGEFGWYCRNTGYNPFTAEGKKTAAFEIWEQIIVREFTDEEERPLTVFVSVGDGNIISGIHKGFKDLQALGWLQQMPRLFGVQAEGSAAVANAYHAGTENIQAVAANTLADSISVDLPRDGVRAVRAARETGGSYVIVTDQDILSAIPKLGRAGIFAEPAGATAYAGFVKAVQDGLIGRDDPVVVINTGSGLKDVKAAMQAVEAAPVIQPSLDALNRVIK